MRGDAGSSMHKGKFEKQPGEERSEQAEKHSVGSGSVGYAPTSQAIRPHILLCLFLCDLPSGYRRGKGGRFRMARAVTKCLEVRLELKSVVSQSQTVGVKGCDGRQVAWREGGEGWEIGHWGKCRVTLLKDARFYYLNIWTKYV